MDSIQQGIQSNRSILCANFINSDGEIRVIASTRYYRLSQESAVSVEEQAVSAEGKTVIFNGSDLTEGDNIMVLARQVREKKNLSLQHIGVIVLYVDVEMLGSTLTQAHDGIFILQGREPNLRYVLNDRNKVLGEYVPDMQEEKGYSIQMIDGETYFVVSFHQKEGFFSYVLLTSYEELFEELLRVFGSYIGMFLLCGTVVILLALISTLRVTRDIRLFIQHIRGITKQNFTSLPLYEERVVRDRDVYALQTAFNTMSTHINRLVKDNYLKQLLIKETQLQVLQSQMNPHFLYNTLNSLYWMVKPAGMTAAAEMISSLGILMREAISNKEFVITIDRELDIACHYLIIQKHRYEDRLEVKFDISEECSSLMIPKFTLQPLIENAIAYGLECILEPCQVEIRIFPENGQCICQVRNSGPAPEEDLIDKLEKGILKPKGNGVGLMNIHQRIQSVYGEEYGVSVYREGEQTVAQIVMRCITEREYREEKQHGKCL